MSQSRRENNLRRMKAQKNKNKRNNREFNLMIAERKLQKEANEQGIPRDLLLMQRMLDGGRYSTSL